MGGRSEGLHPGHAQVSSKGPAASCCQLLCVHLSHTALQIYWQPEAMMAKACSACAWVGT